MQVSDPDRDVRLLMDGSEPEAWTVLDRVLAEWSALQDGWHGGRAQAPSMAGLAMLRKIARSARAEGLPPPRTSIASDGDVGLHWDGPAGTTSMVVTAEEELLAYAPRPGRPGLAIEQSVLLPVMLDDFFRAITSSARTLTR